MGLNQLRQKDIKRLFSKSNLHVTYLISANYIAKAKAGRVGNEITLKCVELAASVGYNEDELLEKWARDSKILDIFEGTQQIQQLIIARRELGKSSSELK